MYKSIDNDFITSFKELVRLTMNLMERIKPHDYAVGEAIKELVPFNYVLEMLSRKMITVDDIKVSFNQMYYNNANLFSSVRQKTDYMDIIRRIPPKAYIPTPNEADTTHAGMIPIGTIMGHLVGGMQTEEEVRLRDNYIMTFFRCIFTATNDERQRRFSGLIINKLEARFGFPTKTVIPAETDDETISDCVMKFASATGLNIQDTSMGEEAVLAVKEIVSNFMGEDGKSIDTDRFVKDGQVDFEGIIACTGGRFPDELKNRVRKTADAMVGGYINKS